MNHQKWEAYLSICRKIESGGRGADGSDNPTIVDEHRRYIDVFSRYLPPTAPDGRPHRVMAPGALSEALLLAELGYEVHALVLGPDNVTWLNDRRDRLPRPELLVARELDAHDLDYPADFFDGYFTVQVHEHWLAWFVHLGEVRATSRVGAVAFVDACGTTNDACKMIWHTNLVPDRHVRDQWEFWGFEPVWQGPHGDDRPQYVFRMLPIDDPKFKNGGYLQWVLRMRSGEVVNYDYNCAYPECTR